MYQTSHFAMRVLKIQDWLEQRLTVASKKNLRMSFTATKEILEFIQNFFKKTFKIEPHPIYRTSEAMNVFRTHYFGDTKKILSLLYKNSTENSRLNRKYKLYVEN